MSSIDARQRRFVAGAALEFIGIITLAAAVSIGWGGVTAVVLGGAAIAAGAVLQISAFLQGRGNEASDWALLKEYSSQLDADLDVASLETADVPSMVRGPEIGIFGPGFSGATPRGVRVYVPTSLLEKARELTAVE